MSSTEDTRHQQQRLTIHRRNLAHYLQQLAHLGQSYAPPSIINGIEEERSNIRSIKRILNEWKVTVDDHPDDEADTSAHFKQDTISSNRGDLTNKNIGKSQVRLYISLVVILFSLLGAVVWIILSLQKAQNYVSDLSINLPPTSTQIIATQIPIKYTNATVVITQGLNIRSLPDIESTYKLKALDAGEAVIITGYTFIGGRTWYRIDVSSQNLRNVWIVSHTGQRKTVVIEGSEQLDPRLYIPFSEPVSTKEPWQP